MSRMVSDGPATGQQSRDSYDEYLMAMKRVYHHCSTLTPDMMNPRERYRKQESKRRSMIENTSGSWDMQQAMRISTIASMVPDEVIYNHTDHSMRSYEAALMFIDVSGFTELCEKYTKAGRGGPSKLTQVLNSYIGAMVQEILTHNGDVLKFSGDAFLSMWKKTSRSTMQDVVHTAIDCGLIIQKNYGRHVTDVGVVLKVKVAISAGISHFSLIGDENISHYVIVGEPVWDVKMAEYMSSAGDVLTTASAWVYVNEADYCTQPCGDGKHTKVLGVGVTWKRVEKFGSTGVGVHHTTAPQQSYLNLTGRPFEEMSYRGYSLRPPMIHALRSSWWPALRPFMLKPVLMAVDNDEPMDFLSEIRHVVVVFLNIITKPVTEDVLFRVVDNAYMSVNSVTSENGGLVNKVSMFDKDMMFLVVFGLRGLKHEDEARKALLCAYQLKETLDDPCILTVSIGLTSGRTYCGVVGNVLRREYTVIGSAVNKAARLMMAYPNRVTCDSETFVRSKLDLDCFRLMPQKGLKGFVKPGPVYEFNKSGWTEHPMCSRHPILGRTYELRSYEKILLNAITRQQERFTKYRDHKYGIAIIGPRMVGKTRLAEEFLYMTVNLPTERIILNEAHRDSYQTIRMLIMKTFIGANKKPSDSIENRIRHSLGSTSLTPLQIYAVNTIFDCRFPLPDNFDYPGDFLSEFSVKNLLYDIGKNNFRTLQVVAVNDADLMDDQSWRILLILLETKSLFVILSINNMAPLSEIATKCLSSKMIVKMNLTGINSLYHGALACQLLDVQAIPADLEKVIESASGGYPGWIQNFLISLVQRGELSVVTVARSEAVEAGAVLPSPVLLQRVDYDNPNSGQSGSQQSLTGNVYTLNTTTRHDRITITESDMIQMAVLPESYNFDDMSLDMTMDVIILKTYDSMTPFEKMLLKCGAVLGEGFSRRMLLHLLQCDSQRKVAQAVAKLFMIRVLECDGGDFTRDTSAVLVHPAPAQPDAKPPYCSCLGTRPSPDCRDLPAYAFCGYMKFRHLLFRTTTYELLTESQKMDLHTRALLYVELNTRKCTACGAGCFSKLFGVHCDDGLIPESQELRQVREQMSAFDDETRLTRDAEDAPLAPEPTPSKLTESSYDDLDDLKSVRSFSSLELGSCECFLILMSVYGEAIHHCAAVGECEKLFETYMEYADLSLINLNIPKALQLLLEAETFVMTPKLCDTEVCKLQWMKSYRLARIQALRGSCMLESGDISEARKHFYYAMELYNDPFPTSKYRAKFRNMKESVHQFLALHVCPGTFIGFESRGIVGQYYEDIARTLTRLYRLFMRVKEYKNAELTAKWALNNAWRTNSTFRNLCCTYGNMIQVYRLKRKFTLCLKLVKKSLDLCMRKRGRLDVTEVYAVCGLYTHIFLFYVEYGKKIESLELGLSVIPLMTSYSDITTCQMLVLYIIKLLLSDARIHEMVMIMREFFYMTDHNDLSSETWYYYYAMVILLDTGYTVESYSACERFYFKKGDVIMRSKTPEAAWNFFVSMWLVTIRAGAWERSILWEEKINHILQNIKCERNEFTMILRIRVVEGYLITLVNEMDNRDSKKVLATEKIVKSMFRDIKEDCKYVPMHRIRYLLMLAYYNYVKENKKLAYNNLNKSYELAKFYAHVTMQVWIHHNRNNWKGTLDPKVKDYWAEHIEDDNLLNYSDFDMESGQIVPYTLPLPKDLKK